LSGLAFIAIFPFWFIPLFNNVLNPLPNPNGFSLEGLYSVVSNGDQNLAILKYGPKNVVTRINIPNSVGIFTDVYMPDVNTVIFFKKENNVYIEWKFADGKTSQIGTVSDPYTVIPPKETIRNIEIEHQSYDYLCSGGGGGLSAISLPSLTCITYTKNAVILHESTDQKIFVYNELTHWYHNNRQLELFGTSHDNALAIVRITQDINDLNHGRLTYAFDLKTGKSALLMDNARDKVLYVK